MTDQYINDAFSGHIEVIRMLQHEPMLRQIEDAVALTLSTLEEGGKVIACGNGGSAADAQHMVGEFVGRFGFDRNPLPALSLTVDTSVLTALVNDYDPKLLFARQLRACGRNGDILFAFSTSGKSPNILATLEVAVEQGIRVVSLTGQNPDQSMEVMSDICLKVPSTQTPRIQEAHQLAYHIIAGLTEKRYFRE